MLANLNVQRGSITKESRLDGTPIRLAPLAPPAPLGLLGPLGPLGDLVDLVVLDTQELDTQELDTQEPRLVLGVLVFLVFLFLVFLFLVFQGHHVLLASQRDQLDQLPLVVLVVQLPPVVQDNLGLPADLAVREYLVPPVVLPVPAVPGGPLSAVVDAFPAVLGCSKWQAEIEPPK